MNLHAGRAAAEAAGWILVAVDCEDENGDTQATAKLICDELEWHGYPPQIDRLRLSAHSRGIKRLNKCVDAKTLFAAAPSGDVFDIAKIERVVALDANHRAARVEATLGRFPSDVTFGFHASDGPGLEWKLAKERTVDLRNPVLGAMCAARIFMDTAQTRLRAAPAKIADIVSELSLPPLGEVSSRNFKTYYAKLDGILKAHKIDASEMRAEGIKSGGMDLYFEHQYFAAEYFHEVMSDEAPQAG